MKTKLLLMLLAIALAAGVAQANLLKNPGFEDGAFTTNFSPDNWENYYTSYGQVHTWINSAAGAHSGSKYIKMYNWLVRAPSYVTSAYIGQEVLDVKEGRDYTFSVWAKNGVEDQVSLANIYIDWLDSAGVSAGVGDPNLGPDEVAIGYGSVNIVVTDANWVEIDFGTFTAPKGAVVAWVFLGAPLANDLRPIFYDDVSMLGADPNITAGVDMISWDGETLSLTGSELLDEVSTITWSAEPDYGADITDGDTLTPTVQVNCIIPSGPATIANHSFENGLGNWEIITGEGHGTWGGYDEPNDVLTLFITPTDGLMCASVDGLSDGAGTLSQVLANNLVAANTTYTLTVDVVNDGYYEENVAYRVQLRAAGGGVLAQDNDGQALDDYGVWATSTVTYESGASPTYLGEPMEIRLIAKNGTNRMSFDNVVLTANPEFPAHVPDVLPIKLTLDIDGKYDTMRIDTYPDACAARLAAGLRETTDLVGDECITNLADLAEMVQTWPDDNAFTEPITRPSALSKPEDIFSINFYYFDSPGYPGGYWDEEYLHTITMEEDEFAGFDTWLIDGWTNINVPWEDYVPTAIGGSSNLASTVTFSLLNSRNGWAINLDPIETDIGNYEMMNAAAFGTEDGDQGTPAWPDQIIDILVEDIPIDKYDVIVYVTAHLHDEIGGDHTGKFVFNGVEQDVTFMEPPFAGNFVEITDSTTPGNYLLFRDVTGDSFTIQMWGNGWNHVGLCGLQFGGPDQLYPSPADGGYVSPTDELELSWANTEPNKPGDPLYVDVWFGTEPNETDPAYDWDLIVDAVEDANSVTVDISTPIPETYYWQVNWYIYGSPTGDPIESRLLSFSAVTDAPVSVNAGGDMLTWSGRKVQLDASIDDDGTSALTIGWSADPNDGVSWPDGTDVIDPNVVITKVTDNPSVVTLILSVQDAVGSDVDTLKIDVYDNPCLAAIGEGQEYDSGDFDVDCDTDLEDYAAVAEEWLVYSELTESIVKP